MFGTPDITDGYLRSTITGPDKRFLRLLQKLEHSEKLKKFKLEGLRGYYTGQFEVVAVCNPRTVIITIYKFSSEPYPGLEF